MGNLKNKQVNEKEQHQLERISVIVAPPSSDPPSPVPSSARGLRPTFLYPLHEAYTRSPPASHGCNKPLSSLHVPPVGDLQAEQVPRQPKRDNVMSQRWHHEPCILLRALSPVYDRIIIIGLSSDYHRDTIIKGL